jgi:hypothetical protein
VRWGFESPPCYSPDARRRKAIEPCGALCNRKLRCFVTAFLVTTMPSRSHLTSLRRGRPTGGRFPTSATGPSEYYRQYRPTGWREVLAKFGVELPKPKKAEYPIPPLVQIGPSRLACAT